MSNCQKCGMPCQGRWCKPCEVEETAPRLTTDDADDEEEEVVD